ncbi:MAG: streptogramin lyase [Candidatus Eremiobacteraeota bacterium]|nr:streptogramin lyase [Candidatus Eremiobacteraeota bacterium]
MSSRYALPLFAAALVCLAIPVRGQAVLPEGPGRDVVQASCAKCHSLDQVSRAGYDRDGWRNVVTMMVNDGAAVPADRVDTVVDYLATNFPPKAAPEAVLLPGSVTVTIKEWIVPTPGSRPHDPLAAPDGSIWYTGQMANALGRLDPASGTFKEYHPPTAASGPHGLVMDADGNVWFTENFAGAIGKLNVRAGTFTEYKLPDPAARDPHTPIFDRNGTLWFTAQGANMIGRLVPRTGEIKLVTVPTPRANPYGMVVTSKGVPWFVEFGSNAIASIDPVTMAIREYRLPNAEARPRRVAITADDTMWYSDYARGYLGRFDPKTGSVTEWPSPGGPNSRPYAIAVLKGAVWYSESGVRPNTLVRFDPQNHHFQTWAIPSGGGVVRNMMVTRDGNLALACSGVNRIALAHVK